MAKHADYDVQRIEARRSAEAVLPLVFDILKPCSVVDVGCGIGAWLAAAADLGVDEYLGLDGPWVLEEDISFDWARFQAADLTAPLRLGRTFDLVMCLEVAEHLDEAFADVLLANLAELGSVVLFSAAIPNQGGLGHVNEQWPEYWVGKFSALGFEVVDGIRTRIWKDERVSWWYAQNILLFVKPEVLEGSAQLQAWRNQTHQEQLALVHPRKLDGVYREMAWTPPPEGWVRRLIGKVRGS